MQSRSIDRKPYALATALLTVALGGGPGCADKSSDSSTSSNATANETSAAQPAAPTLMPQTDPPPLPNAEVTAASTSEGLHQWSRQIGGPGRDSARAVAIGRSGDIYIGGLFKGKTSVAGKSFESDDIDAMIIKLDAKGTPQWARQFGGPGPDMIESLVLDANDNIIVGGSFADKLQIGSSSVGSKGSDDAFVAKFDADGKRLWAKRIGDVAEDDIQAVAVDSAGNVYASATIRGYVTLNDVRYPNRGELDAYLIALDQDGQYRWVQSIAGTEKDIGRGIAIDSADNVIWAAEFAREATVGSGKDKIATVRAAGNSDVVLSSFTGLGALRWAYSYGGLADDTIFSLAIDKHGELAATGTFSETLSIGKQTTRSAGELDAYVARFAPNGTPRWLTSFGSRTEDVGSDVRIDASGNVYATGWFRGRVDFGGGELKSAGEKDIYMLKLSPTGDHLWSKRFGGTQVDYGKKISVNLEGNPVLVGTFYLKASFGGEEFVVDSGGARVPQGQMFVLQLSQ